MFLNLKYRRPLEYHYNQARSRSGPNKVKATTFDKRLDNEIPIMKRQESGPT